MPPYGAMLVESAPFCILDLDAFHIKTVLLFRMKLHVDISLRCYPNRKRSRLFIWLRRVPYLAGRAIYRWWCCWCHMVQTPLCVTVRAAAVSTWQRSSVTQHLSPTSSPRARTSTCRTRTAWLRSCGARTGYLGESGSPHTNQVSLLFLVRGPDTVADSVRAQASCAEWLGVRIPALTKLMFVAS